MKNMRRGRGKSMETIRTNTVTEAEKHMWYGCPPFRMMSYTAVTTMLHRENEKRALRIEPDVTCYCCRHMLNHTDSYFTESEC